MEKKKEFKEIKSSNPISSSSASCRVCELLQGGAVMNKVYQPHEGHIPYLLQLFIDFNLYGMNLLNLAAVRFRRSSRAGEHSDQSPVQVLQSSQVQLVQHTHKTKPNQEPSGVLLITQKSLLLLHPPFSSSSSTSYTSSSSSCCSSSSSSHPG